MEDLRKRLDEIGPAGYVLVDEVIDGDRQRRGRVSLVEFLDGWGEKVGENWGAGAYVCDARDAKTFLKKGIELGFSASYGAGKKGKGATAAASATAPPAPGGLELLLAEIRAQATRQHDVMMELLRKPGSQAGSALTASDIAREVERVIAQRMPAGQHVDQAQLFNLATRLVRDVRGAGTDEDAMTVAIREGAKLLGGVFGRGGGADKGAGDGAGGNGHGADEGGKETVDFRAMAYRSILGQLLEAQKAGYTPEKTAAEFWKNLPAELVGAVYDVMQREDWLAFLSGYTPAILSHQEWFGELRAELLKSYEGAAS